MPNSRARSRDGDSNLALQAARTQSPAVALQPGSPTPTQTMMEQHRPWTNLQRELLELFAFDVPEEELRQIKALLARHFAEKATSEMDRFMGEQNLTREDLERWAHEHERAATDRS